MTVTEPAAPERQPAILAVHVGGPRTVRWRGREITTAIWKHPVTGPVQVAGINLDGDAQVDRRVHGGPDKAVYAYAYEDYLWWASQRPGLEPGTFGENLTTLGLDLVECRIGDRWHVGDTVLEVAQPRSPCFKLGIRVGDDSFPAQFEAARRPGLYLRIVSPGTVEAGAAISVLPAEPPALRIGDLSTDASTDVLRRACVDARVPEGWRRAAERALARPAP